MKVYRNMLPTKEFKDLTNNLINANFPWYYNKGVVYEHEDGTPEDKKNFQFTHSFYMNDVINSDHFKILIPLIKIINPLTIVRIKANLLTRTSKIIEHGYHTDYDENSHKLTTGIFYLNTNNGYTKFKNKKVVKSEANKYIEFKGEESHTGSTCTDENIMVVINFNYIKKCY